MSSLNITTWEPGPNWGHCWLISDQNCCRFPMDWPQSIVSCLFVAACVTFTNRGTVCFNHN